MTAMCCDKKELMDDSADRKAPTADAWPLVSLDTPPLKPITPELAPTTLLELGDGTTASLSPLLVRASKVLFVAFEHDRKESERVIVKSIPNAATLEHIMRYLEYHKKAIETSQFMTSARPALLQHGAWSDICPFEPWEATFIETLYKHDASIPCRLITVAQHLDIDRLFYLSCAFFATLLRGKQYAQVHDLLKTTRMLLDARPHSSPPLANPSTIATNTNTSKNNNTSHSSNTANTSKNNNNTISNTSTSSSTSTTVQSTPMSVTS